MNIFNADCLEKMKDIENKSVDLFFTDLPYGETSCKWDSCIDLELMWKQFKRIRKDTTPIIFTCSTKFGYTLIESNKKEFRYDMVWVKSAPVGFLNAKRMPMKKHEMVYIFYKKCPTETYGNNIKKYHKHKFLDNDNNNIKENNFCNYDVNKNVYGGGKDNRIKISKDKKDHQIKYNPPLPNSIIKENKDYDNREIKERNTIKKEENYGKSYLDKKVNFRKYNPKLGGNNQESHLYNPPLPNSIIKEDDNKRPTDTYKNNSDIYGKIDRPDFKRKNNESMYKPPLPNSILEIKSQKGKHSTQKPTQLSDFFIKYYSNENDLVLDCCMGSGSTGLSCKNLNRRFIGIEKNEEIFNIAKDRLNH